MDATPSNSTKRAHSTHLTPLVLLTILPKLAADALEKAIDQLSAFSKPNIESDNPLLVAIFIFINSSNIYKHNNVSKCKSVAMLLSFSLLILRNHLYLC